MEKIDILREQLIKATEDIDVAKENFNNISVSFVWCSTPTLQAKLIEASNTLMSLRAEKERIRQYLAAEIAN